MQNFVTSLIAVSLMVAYAIPGFLFIRSKLIKSESISALANVLLYFCQPGLVLYSFSFAQYSRQLLIDIVICFAFSLLLHGIFLVGSYLLLRKNYENIANRLLSIATNFGNVGFFGVPLLKVLLPENPEAMIFSAVFSLSLNIMSWTVASFLITGDKKHISVKKTIINPSVLPLLIAIPMFMTNTKYPVQIQNMITIIGGMSTAVAMLILGMRLATFKISDVFRGKRQYIVLVSKQILMPLVTLLLIKWMPLTLGLKYSIFILSCTPVANIILSFAEIYQNGQEEAAKMIIVSTLTCVFTVPVMLLMLPLLS